VELGEEDGENGVAEGCKGAMGAGLESPGQGTEDTSCEQQSLLRLGQPQGDVPDYQDACRGRYVLRVSVVC
jgi:hypothetical protein